MWTVTWTVPMAAKSPQKSPSIFDHGSPAPGGSASVVSEHVPTGPRAFVPPSVRK
jgi:hypothetical protein